MTRLLLRRVRVADFKALKSFLAAVPDTIDVERHNTAIVWCENLSWSITAAQYK